MTDQAVTTPITMPTFESLLATCNRTVAALEEGKIAASQGNAIHKGVGAIVSLIRLELDAAKLMARQPTLLAKMLPQIDKLSELPDGSVD